MNNSDIYSSDFTRSLPPPLKDDPEINALGRVIAEQLQITAKQIRRNIIYARIDELDEQTLDILAYDLHVDWYDYSYPIEAKRQTIKDSVKIHRRLGTKYAVETALGAVFHGTRVEEWFEYGGNPYTFRVIIGVAESGITAERQEAVLKRVRFYKNLRSHLEAIKYRMEESATVYAVAVHAIGVRLEINPYVLSSFEESTSVFPVAVHAIGVRLEINPYLRSSFEESTSVFSIAATMLTNRIKITPALERSITMNGQIPFGGYTQQTRRIEIHSF